MLLLEEDALLQRHAGDVLLLDPVGGLVLVLLVRLDTPPVPDGVRSLLGVALGRDHEVIIHELPRREELGAPLVEPLGRHVAGHDEQPPQTDARLGDAEVGEAQLESVDLEVERLPPAELVADIVLTDRHLAGVPRNDEVGDPLEDVLPIRRCQTVDVLVGSPLHPHSLDEASDDAGGEPHPTND